MAGKASSAYRTSSEVTVPTGGRAAFSGRMAVNLATGALPLRMTTDSPGLNFLQKTRKMRLGLMGGDCLHGVSAGLGNLGGFAMAARYA